ncbi:MAG TPA: heme-binding protein [Clostridia bacterium]|nr:heme-binding protein [Clostridia bacterium]
MNRQDVEGRVAAAVAAALRTPMTLERAKALIAGVETLAAEAGVHAVIAVCDEGGNPVALHRMDGGFIASLDIALNKAYTSVSLQRPTKDLAALAQPGAPLYGIQWTNGGRIVIFGGGEPLVSGGTIVGGLGVSGGTLEQDTRLAELGRKVWEQAEKEGL